MAGRRLVADRIHPVRDDKEIQTQIRHLNINRSVVACNANFYAPIPAILRGYRRVSVAGAAGSDGIIGRFGSAVGRSRGYFNRVIVWRKLVAEERNTRHAADLTQLYRRQAGSASGAQSHAPSKIRQVKGLCAVAAECSAEQGKQGSVVGN